MNALKFNRFPELDYACNEAFNTLCTNLAFTGSEVKTIMITSSDSSDGKSFVSMNAARNMTMLGKRVAVVDADLRRSKLSSRYKISYSTEDRQGLSNYLAGVCDINSVIYSTNIPNLYIVPPGHEVTNSLSLLNSPRMPNLLKQLREQADYVIVDAPPVGLLIDAAEIAKYCDGTLFVVGYNKTRRREIVECKKQIERSGCLILGAVLNDVNLNSYISRKYYYKTYYRKNYTGGGTILTSSTPRDESRSEWRSVGGFTDIHHHLIYGIDDGPASFADMTEMIRAARRDGIEAIIATPHIYPGIRRFDYDAYDERLEEAKVWCENERVAVKIYRGAEVLYTPQLGRMLWENSVPRMRDTDRVLIEFMPDEKPDVIEAALKTVARAECVPIIAHVERIRSLVWHTSRFIGFKRSYEALFQINCSSVLGKNDIMLARTLGRLLSEEQIDFMATDAHNTMSRGVCMTRAYSALSGKYGKAYADRMTGRVSA